MIKTCHCALHLHTGKGEAFGNVSAFGDTKDEAEVLAAKEAVLVR